MTSEPSTVTGQLFAAWNRSMGNGEAHSLLVGRLGEFWTANDAILAIETEAASSIYLGANPGEAVKIVATSGASVQIEVGERKVILDFSGPMAREWMRRLAAVLITAAEPRGLDEWWKDGGPR